MEKHQLSKSSFIRSVQCLKSLFLYKNFYRLKDPLTKEKQAVFNRGTQVGILAQQLFPGGTDVSPSSPFKYDESVVKTQELIKAGATVIYEAAFMFDRVLVALDILVKKENKWYAYEVKSSAKISSVYVMDACLQYYVIKNVLPGLEDFSIININSSYKLAKQLDLHQLFKTVSVKQDANRNLPFIEDRITKAKNALAQELMPDVAIGEHCFSPYDCDFMGTCWKKQPNTSVFELSGVSKSKQFEWYKKGYRKIEDIPDNSDVAETVRKQIQAQKSGKEFIEKDKLAGFYQKIKYPVCFMDIEVMMPVVPVFEGTQPFQQIPFLFSVHCLKAIDAVPEHKLFIAEVNQDPRVEFIQQLIAATKDYPSVVVYDEQMEKSVINRLAQDYPEYKKELAALTQKIIDFAVPFQQQWYYRAEMKGSFSLKNIFPALCKDSSFEKLAINSGVQAMYAYLDIQQESDLFKVAEVKEQLSEYCQTDTLALMKVFCELYNKAI